MKKIYLYSTLLAIVVAACDKAESVFPQSNQEPTSEVKMIVETVSGTSGSTTRATIADADASFAWTDGDNIAVHVSSSTSSKYVFTSDSENGAAGADVDDSNTSQASFKVAYESTYSRDAFAVYPSNIVSVDAANYGQSGSTLDVTLPGSYTFEQLTGTTSPCPMIATNAENSDWTFYQLCGLLRLSVHTIPPTAKRLEIDFDGKKVWGNFSIENPAPGTSVIATSADNDHDVITVTKDGTNVTLNDDKWKDGLVLNIPLPTGTYTKITVTAYDALTEGNAVFTKTRTFSYEASKERGVKRDIPAVFSISDSKRVVFAPGNLRATYDASAKTWTWDLAEHQYDFIGNAGGNKLITTYIKEDSEPYAKLSGNGTVDLFGWSSTTNYYGIATSTSFNDYVNPSASSQAQLNADFIDWGSIEGIDGKPAGFWRSMTCNVDPTYEWGYLMRHRPTGVSVNGIANARYTLATINNDNTPVNGIIIFPDKYSGPTANTSDGAIVWGTKINDWNSGEGWGGTVCTSAGWNILELEGCVFLPAAGNRVGTNVNFEYSNYASNYSSSLPGIWLLMKFKSTNTGNYNVYWNENTSKHRGASVRLVHQVN